MCLWNLVVPLVQVTDFQKYCSQNRLDNAFTFATPFCLRFKDTLADDHLICWHKKHRRIKFFVPTRLRGSFFTRKNLNTNLHCCCMRLHCSPPVLPSSVVAALPCVVGLFSSVVWTSSSGIFASLPSLSRIWWGSVPRFQLDASFCLRGLCAGLAQNMQLDFSDWGPAEN